MAEELRSKLLWRAVFAELFATAFFVYLVTSVLISPQTVTQIALGIGLAISVLVQIVGPISGAHINPAVTIGVLVHGGCSVVKAIFYTFAQLIGGVIGAAITYGLTPKIDRGTLGNLQLSPTMNHAQGFFVEMFLTMLLVFTVLASTSTDHNRQNLGYANALAIGVSISVAHLVGVQSTGCGINPARAFGPAIVADIWETYHWIYWIAPYLGGIVSGLVYRFVIGVEITEAVQVQESYNNLP